MATVISFGIQKGGVGKTTSTVITSTLLANLGYKVLVIDFDSQGNTTKFLTRRNIYDFSGHTVFEAILNKSIEGYVFQTDQYDNLHIMAAEDKLAGLTRYLYREYDPHDEIGIHSALTEVVDMLRDEYDFILIDCPPNLGEHTINAISACDYAVVMLQTEPMCYDALERYMYFLQDTKETFNPNLHVAGILCAMQDARTSVDKATIKRAKKDFGPIVFDSIIHRRSRIKEYSVEGITMDTKLDQKALKPYISFVEELIERVGHTNAAETV